MAELPMTGLGTKSVQTSVPVQPIVPQNMGERSLSTQKPSDVMDPVIHSLSYINDSIDTVASVVGDIEPVTVGDLEKLFQKYVVGKKDFSDAVVDGLSRQTSQVKENSFLVKNQVKADEVSQKTVSKQSDPSHGSGQSGGGRKGLGGGSGFGAADAYKSALGAAHDLATNPMKLVDKLAELPFKGIDKIAGLFKGGGSSGGSGGGKGKKTKEDFFGPDVGKNLSEDLSVSVGEVVDRDFQKVDDGFSEIFSEAHSLIQSNQDLLASGGSAVGPLGNAGDPFYVIDISKGGGSNTGGAGSLGKPAGNVESVQDKAAKSSIKADNVMFDTFDDPEKSKFGNFLDKEIVSGGEGKSKGPKAEGGFLAVIIGLVLAGLLAFKDVVTAIFEKVLIPLGQVAVEFFRALKDPLIKFINAFIDVAVVFFNIVKEILIALKPYLIQIAVAIAGVILEVLNIVKKVLVALEPYIIKIAEVIAGIILTILGIVQDILVAIKPYLIKIAEVISGIILEVLKTVKDVIVAIREPVIRMAKAISGIIATVLETIRGILEKIKDPLIKIVDIVMKTLVPIMEVVGSVIQSIFTAIKPIVDVLGKALGFVGNVVANGLEKVGSFVGGLVDKVVNAVSEPDPTTDSLFKAMTKDLQMPDKDIPLLQGIFKHTFVISEILVSHFKDDAKALSKKKVNDLVISSEGREFQPTNDAVFAINSGVVSVVPSKSVNEYTGNPSSSYTSSQVQNNSQGVVNNNYVSNYDLSGMGPYSEFCPVGV